MNITKLENFLKIFLGNEKLNYNVTFNDKYSYSNKIIHIDKNLMLQPFCRIIDDCIYIKYTAPITKEVIKFLKAFESLKIKNKIFLVKYIFPEKQKIDSEYALRFDEISNVFYNLVYPLEIKNNCKSLKLFIKNKLKFEKYLFDYVIHHNSQHIFQDVHNKYVIGDILNKTDYLNIFTSNKRETIIKDLTVISYLKNLNRLFKIKKLVNLK